VPNTKGSNVVELVRFLRSRRDEARDLLPPELHHYLEDRIEVTRWYPEEDSVGLQRAVAALLPVADDDAYELMGSLNAQLHRKGVYQHLFENVRTEVLPVRIIALWSSVHDTGKVRISLPKPGRSRIDLADFEATSREVCKSTTGYIREIFRMANVENLDVRKTACRLSGDDLCSWTVTWDPEET
jgi:hypothetical protein